MIWMPNKMELAELVRRIPNLADKGHADKIKVFAWHFHVHKNRERINQAMIRACYDELHLERPSNVSPYIQQLMKKKPPEVLKDRKGYYLEGRVRADLDSRYGQREITVKIHKLLSDLTGKVSDEAESKFLSEVLICLKHGAFRAAIVMAWNLAYSHFIEWVFANHLAAFNSQIPINFSKSKVQIARLEDFGEFKESNVIMICRSAKLIDANLKKILSEKLDRRNMAAHPSLVEIDQIEAEAMISDLIKNVILKL